VKEFFMASQLVRLCGDIALEPFLTAMSEGAAPVEDSRDLWLHRGPLQDGLVTGADMALTTFIEAMEIDSKEDAVVVPARVPSPMAVVVEAAAAQPPPLPPLPLPLPPPPLRLKPPTGIGDTDFAEEMRIPGHHGKLMAAQLPKQHHGSFTLNTTEYKKAQVQDAQRRGIVFWKLAFDFKTASAWIMLPATQPTGLQSWLRRMKACARAQDYVNPLAADADYDYDTFAPFVFRKECTIVSLFPGTQKWCSVKCCQYPGYHISDLQKKVVLVWILRFNFSACIKADDDPRLEAWLEAAFMANLTRGFYVNAKKPHKKHKSTGRAPEPSASDSEEGVAGPVEGFLY
jgi:hypothetical protein